MRKCLVLLFLLAHFLGWTQLRLCSWNVCDLGKSKNDATIEFIAQTLRNYDLVALQEIVAGPEGPKALARLADALNRTGSKWEYVVSAPTQGDRQKRERYAFLWKSSRVMLVGTPWLDQNFAAEVEREPFLGTFRYENNELTIVNFHAITKKLQPEREIKYFKFFPEKYIGHNLVFTGDFNCPQTHSVFSPLKKSGFSAVFSNTKTTLKTACVDGNCTASEFDNFFYFANRMSVENKGAAAFYSTFQSLKEARKISDHLPIWVEFRFK
ncbi:endonuclease/exonuclease/phosphatase family protein [Flavobacterium selenitireducens]|uniref:endonuclease/exonuclease/phosphatase family protein n=1 Tax=Flavobacterium selenitireducens TaxID=2722704 RepID=UPI00168AB382|nr:endonuclease/exonuclease/phosphatase family protein [Flavobacterium selenitireducens]MBD3581735.1 endonuclease/exonuclease/phosphatase family protein [Flavobacterium selenitireducens]